MPVSKWNSWVNGQVTAVQDRRYDLDSDTVVGTLTAGIDRMVNERVSVGFSVALNSYGVRAFDDTLRADATGFTAGPYAAVRLNEHWALSNSLTYGLTENQLSISVLDGSYETHQVAASFELNGQYTVHGIFVRPKISTSLTYFYNTAYDLSGTTLAGREITSPTPASDDVYGIVTASAEFSRLFALANGDVFMPFVRVGVDYEYLRPGDGAILTGELALATPEPWAGTVELGARAVINKNLLISARGAYRSIGQPNFDVWEAELMASFSF